MELAQVVDHGGIVLYTDRIQLIGDPIGSTEAIAAMDQFYPANELRNTVERLNNWR